MNEVFITVLLLLNTNSLSNTLRHLDIDFIYMECSDISNYDFSLDPTIKITRKNYSNYDETGYIIFKPGIENFNSSQNLEYIFNVVSLNEGGIFMGVCGFEGSNRNTCLNNYNDVFKKINFSGLSIKYFGHNCYYIDHYLNNLYYRTAQNCLSEYELLNFNFEFNIDFIGLTNYASLKIKYDNYFQFDQNNLYVISDPSNDNIITSLYPCAYLMSKYSSIIIK